MRQSLILGKIKSGIPDEQLHTHGLGINLKIP